MHNKQNYARTLLTNLHRQIRFHLSMPMAAATLFALAILPSSALAAEFYVAPNGSSSGNGSISNPWKLATALAHPAAVRPGDTIWLRGGVYSGAFVSTLNGSSAGQITVRQYLGERAVLDRAASASFEPALKVLGNYVNFWGFEMTNSFTDRIIQERGSNPSASRPAGVMTYSTNIKLINLIIHDQAGGMGHWSTTEDANSEVYGCLVYNNGWLAPDRGHGHGVYAQNQRGYKRISDNIVFNGFNQGLQIYGSGDGSYINNFEITDRKSVV